MRTVNKVGGANGTIFTEFYGNTTDVKPTEDVPNGSAFYEVDNNMQEYRFDKENKIWYPITRGGTAPSGDYLPLSGGTMSGNINMNGHSVYTIGDLVLTKGVQLKDYTVNNRKYLDIRDRETMIKVPVKAGNAVEDDELVTKSQMETADSKYLPLTGTTEGNPVTGVITFNGENTITGVSTPVNDTDVVTKKYADDIKTELDDKTNQLKEDLDDITYTDKSDNILEISAYTEGQYYSASSGNIRYNDNFFTVDNYVEVKPSISYVLSEFIDGVFSKLLSAIIIFYDKSKNFLSGGQYSTFTTPEDAKYIRLSLNKDAIGKQLLLEKGTEPTKVWSPYSETRYVKGSKIIDLSYNILKNKPTINGVEVVGEKTLDDYGISSASEIAETYGLYKINEIAVDINGNGDFERLQDAIKSITDNSKNNRYVIYIKEGNYDLAEGITDGENDSAVIGVTIPNWVTLRGLGSRENIILKAKFTNKMQYVSTLNFQETGAIENLTVIGENTRYTIHDDFARKSSGYKRNVKHCIIKGITTYYSTVYGAGTGDGADWEFEDVVFDGSQVGANSKPANTFTVHNILASQKNRSIVFKNCIFVSANKKNVKFKTLAYRTSTGADNANNMITNVSLYGCKFDGTDEGFELVEENPNVYGKGCYYYVNGYGNINAGYEIITTDGKDYSNRVNLI